MTSLGVLVSSHSYPNPLILNLGPVCLLQFGGPCTGIGRLYTAVGDSFVGGNLSFSPGSLTPAKDKNYCPKSHVILNILRTLVLFELFIFVEKLDLFILCADP